MKRQEQLQKITVLHALMFMAFTAVSPADVWSIRYENRGDARKALHNKINGSDAIVAGEMFKAVKWEEGVWTSVEDKQVKGYWHEVLFKVGSTIKGNVTDKIVPVRFFMSGDPTSALFQQIPNEGKCLLFLEKPTKDSSHYLMIPQPDEVLQLAQDTPDARNEKDSVSHLKMVIRHTLVSSPPNSTPSSALEMLLYLTDDSQWVTLLEELSRKVPAGTKGIVLAYRLSLGDITAAAEIDRLISDGPSDAEYSTISTALAELKDPKLKPFLVKWSSCDNPSISKAAIQTLVTFRDSSMVPLLVSALDSEDSLVRLRALHSLSRIEGYREKDGKALRFTRDDDKDAVKEWKLWWQEKGKDKYQHKTGSDLETRM